MARTLEKPQGSEEGRPLEERRGEDRRGEERRLFYLSTLPVVGMFLLHGVHLLLIPLLAGLGLSAANTHHAHGQAEAGMHMSMPMSGASPLSWMTFILFMLNGMAPYYAGRLMVRLWRNRSKRRGRAGWIQAALSLLSVGAGIAAFAAL